MKRVYFIRAIGLADSPVKIGCSIAPDGRRATLQTWIPFPLEIAAEIDGGLKVEGQFHAMFVAQRTHGEWFRPSAELDAVIEAIRDGRFDVGTLPAPIDLRRLGGNYPTGPLSPEKKAHRAAIKERYRAHAARSARSATPFSPDSAEAVA